MDPGAERRYSRVVGVGNGSRSNGVEMEYAVKGIAHGRVQGCVTVGGAPAAGARVSGATGGHGAEGRERDDQRGGGLPQLRRAPWRSGNWRLAAGVRGAALPGRARDAHQQHLQRERRRHRPPWTSTLPATGRLSAHVVDESGLPLPARVTVVGFDPSPPQTESGPSLPGLGSSTLGLLEDPKEAVPFGIVAFGYSDASGNVAFDVEPGSYQVCGEPRHRVLGVPGAAHDQRGVDDTSISAQIARVLDTTGFVSSDFHVHGIRSADSRVADAPSRRRSSRAKASRTSS